jgi:hypothetical protein
MEELRRGRAQILDEQEGRVERKPVEMKPDKSMKLADLMYGHGSEFMCSLSGRFNPEKYPDAPPIQICEMKCGCWIVADGNNRVGLILKKSPEATIADIPEGLLATARFGEWDAEVMDWWNPRAKSFREVMGKPGKKARVPKTAFTGSSRETQKESLLPAPMV